MIEKAIVTDNKNLDTEKQKSQPEVNIKSPQSQPDAAAAYCCKYCDQCFKFKQSMYRHIKYTCTKNKDEDLKELVRLLNLKLEKERMKSEIEWKEIHKELKKQAKQIDKMGKVIGKLTGKIVIHDSFNNNTINNITLLLHRDTDVSHLTKEDYICISNQNRLYENALKRS